MNAIMNPVAQAPDLARVKNHFVFNSANSRKDAALRCILVNETMAGEIMLAASREY